MQKEQLIAIAEKISEGTASREEMVLYVQYIDSFIAQYPEWEQVDAGLKEKIEKEISAEIRLRIEESESEAGKEEHAEPGIVQLPLRRRIWPGIAIVAAAVAAVVFGIWLYNYKENASVPGNDLANDIAPGHTGATLTLSNGKQIKLSDAGKGQLARQGGVSIMKTSDGSIIYQAKGELAGDNVINTLSTSNGETYQLRLPDGSLVWLNAASTLSYSANLIQGGKRTVKLSGEGYFEVAKDKAHPFVVESKGQQVEVLGTHFNINNYADEPVIRTTLLEGSVEVAVAGSSHIIKPGEQAVVTGDELKVSEVNVEEAVAWKNGLFKFNKTNLKAVMRQMSRWYDVEIVYEGNVPDKLFTGEIYRNQNASQVLELLKFYKLNYRLEKEKIIVYP